MIEIVITRYTTEQYEQTTQMCIEEEPTDKREENGYGSGNKPVMARKYQPVVERKTRTKEQTLLKQQIDDEDEFNLPSVISAINNLERS